MTAEQYDEFLGGLCGLREALGLPIGALDIAPRDAFIECIEKAAQMRVLLEQAEKMLRHGAPRIEMKESLAEAIGMVLRP
jgi:hypothetical protein